MSGRADGILATFSGLDADGNGAIRPGSTATLGIQGRLNGNVTAEDLVGGGSAGVQNCASGTATSSINGVGSRRRRTVPRSRCNRPSPVSRA